jgi:hypothetical protein
MRVFIILLFCCFLPVHAQQMISDFCPDKLGNEWVYLYQRVPLGYDFSGLMISESLNVVVTLDDYEMINSDTSYIFHIYESGIRTTVSREGESRTESIGNRFNISVYLRLNIIVVVNDAFYDEILSRDEEPVAAINPLYRAHSVNSAGLKRVWTGNDSLYLLDAGAKRFAQNIGLVYDSLRSTGNCVLKTKLLSFNGEMFSLWGSPVQNPLKMKTAGIALQKTGTEILHLCKKSPLKNGAFFSLNGQIYRGGNETVSSVVVKLKLPSSRD